MGLDNGSDSICDEALCARNVSAGKLQEDAK